MPQKSSRRRFLKTSALAGAGFWVAARPAFSASKSPNEKLSVAGVGVGGKGRSDVQGCTSENIVALCDVCDERAAAGYKAFPKARRFHDYREMFDKMHKEIDAVTVSTPDHMHAAISIMAMKLGKHVYVQKPLCKDVAEARLMLKVAQETGVATQMGNQGTASNNLRDAVEVMRAGDLGDIVEIHAWTNRASTVWPQGARAILDISGVDEALHGRTAGRTEVPKSLKWDLWLGNAPERPYYSKAYHPFNWRGWWDFGTGAIGDMAMHVVNMAWMGCELKYPTSVEAEVSEYNSETFPIWSIVRFEFPPPAPGKPPIQLTWYDGGKDKPARVHRKLSEMVFGNPIPESGCIIVGNKGRLYCPVYNGKYMLLPEKDFEGYQPPTRTLPRSPGHCQEWINACKGGPAPMSNFGYAAPFTEAFVLGCVAMRFNRKLEWDGPKMKVTNAPEANQYLQREYRKGWQI